MSDLIDRSKLLEVFEERKKPNNGGEDGTKERYRYMQWLTDYNAVKEAPPAEPTDEAVALYCKRRCLKIITEELYLHLKQGLYNPQPFVHCHDCESYVKHDKRCKVWNHGVEECGFCYRGGMERMSDLIDRWKAIETICKASCEDMSETTRKQCALNDACEVVEMFKDVPSAEPKKGKWIDETFKPWGLVHHPYKCDQCGEHSEADSDYCPNCGADMRGEEEC